MLHQERALTRIRISALGSLNKNDFTASNAVLLEHYRRIYSMEKLRSTCKNSLKRNTSGEAYFFFACMHFTINQT